MTRFLLYLLATVILPLPAYAGWKVESNAKGGYQAMLAIDLIGTRVPSIAILIVDFDPRVGCKPAIGTMVFKGSSLGELKKKGRAKRHKMSIIIDGKPWLDYPYIVLYSNGVEGIVPADRKLLDALKESKRVESKISPSTPTIEFNTSSAGPTIEVAQMKCIAG